MKRIADEPAPTRAQVQLLTGPDDRVLLEEELRHYSADNLARAIEYMNAQWAAMSASPVPPTGIRVVNPDGTERILSRGPIVINLVPGGFRRNGRVVVDNPKCAACVEGKHRDRPEWHTWADDMALEDVPDAAVTQRCSCECAGPRELALKTREV